MKTRSIIIAAAAALLGAGAWLSAQSPMRASKDGVIRPFWECTTPAGTYIVPLDRISNLSTHQYVVQGAGRVWEIVLADDSSAIARYYYMDPASKLDNPVTGSDTAKFTEEALDTIAKETKTEKVWQRVVKAYPQATHAHTVEYRVESRKVLTKIYEHLRECWMVGRPGRLIIQEEEK